MIGYGFNVTAHFVTSVDLNAAIVDGIDWVSKKVASVEVRSDSIARCFNPIY